MGERRKTAAGRGLWRGVAWASSAAASVCVASWSVGRTLDEAAGATGPSEAVERIGAFEPFAASTEEAFAAETTGDAASDAERLLRESIVRLEGLRSLSADLNFEARLFGERYFGRGRYEETTEAPASATGGAARRSPLERARFRLRASIARGSAKEARGGEENVFEVVCDCDRQALWSYSSVEGGKSLTRIDVAELSNALASLEGDELAAVGVEGPCAANGLPGLGGLTGTLRRLATVYRFEPRIEAAPAFKGADVVKITGRARSRFWSESRRRLGVDEIPPFLAENLPGNVEIYFGADWPFPYKIVYFSLSENEERTRKDVFVVEYSSVVRNDASIRPENFSYNQPQITFERVTSRYVDELISEAELWKNCEK